MLVHLSGATTSVVIDVSPGVPVIEHWGRRLTSIDGFSPSSPVPHGGLDTVTPASCVPAEGFLGRPGLAGHRRGGRHWSPRPRYVGHQEFDVDGDSPGRAVRVVAFDEIAELEITTRLELVDDVLSIAVDLTNVGSGPYMLDALTVTVPMPDRGTRLGTYSGHWGAEFGWRHAEWPMGAWTVENRTGRTSHEHLPYLWVTSADADEWNGDVWGLHLAWSGNHVLYAERLVDGRRYVQLGELFHPGEMCVYPGETYTTPSVIGVRSDHGFTPASWGFHRDARRRVPRPPSSISLPPRKVHVNTWEAVYFDHDVERLKELAEAAAAVGAERFVLDDGWFGDRRHDRAGLGDWTVSPEVYPDGLAPLIEHVHSLGMDFGIWVEPEMVNPDSELLRTHPEWALVTEGYEPVLGRHQLVLDLTRSDAFDHVLARLDTLLADHAVAYVKWDMNRWVVQGSGADGKAAAHDQTAAVYRLLDELRRRHPRVEFESCASGGGRIDHEMLRRVERFWTSDNNDALERSVIHHRASMVMPPEVLGSHVGPSPAHNTGRRLPMAFRTAVAMFGHMGIEADVTRLDERERAVLRHGVELYKTWREFVHHGRFVRFDRGPDAVCFGVLSDDASQLLVCHVQIAAPSVGERSTNWRFPGLDPERNHRVRVVPLVPDSTTIASDGAARRQPDWWSAASSDEPPVVSGAVLREIGLAAPLLAPQRAVVLHLSGS
jgi:alpha-galactosidase